MGVIGKDACDERALTCSQGRKGRDRGLYVLAPSFVWLAFVDVKKIPKRSVAWFSPFLCCSLPLKEHEGGLAKRGGEKNRRRF
jgi:hypothetical protein